MASVTQHRGQGDAAEHAETPDAAREPTATLSQDELFDILSNRRRRYVVQALERHYGEADIDDVALQVAAWEYEVGVKQVSEDEHKRVYTALQQSHLPMMDAAGVLEFDKYQGTVQRTNALDELEAYMGDVQRDEFSWSVYYLGLSTVAASLIAAVWAGAWPFTLLPDVAWGAVVVAMFAALAVAHAVSTST